KSSRTYLAVTTTNRAQRISDSTPRTMMRVTGCPCAAPATASRKAYSGEVPMSPNTTPMLPSVSDQKLAVAGSVWVSLEETLIAMLGWALSIDRIRYRENRPSRHDHI